MVLLVMLVSLRADWPFFYFRFLNKLRILSQCMARNKKNNSKRPSRHGGYNKVKARTEQMNTGVRLALCALALTATAAFMVAALQPHRKLNRMRSDLAEVHGQEMAVIERKDAKERELRAIEENPAYLELIARDRLNYYKPGEHVFRIER